MFPFETDFCLVLVDDTLQVAILKWKRPVSLNEYQEGIRNYILLLEKYNLKRSLMDSTLRGELNFESDEWIFRAIKSEIGGLDIENHQLALVMTEARYQQLVQNYSLLQSGTLELPVNINYFTNPDEALHWLVHESSITKKQKGTYQ